VKKVVAILQNMWFKDPERVKETVKFYVDKKGEEAGRERFIRDMLFFGCLTGRRLRAAFTWDVCAEIVWEEASRKIGGHASSKFPHDCEHVAEVIRRHQPSVVMAFGKIACSAIGGSPAADEIVECGAKIITAPHPAARGADTVRLLAEAARALKEIV